MLKEDNQSQAQLPNRNILKLVLITKQSAAQVNHIMVAELASLGLSPNIRLEGLWAAAESDPERLTEPLVSNMEGEYAVVAVKDICHLQFTICKFNFWAETFHTC